MKRLFTLFGVALLLLLGAGNAFAQTSSSEIRYDKSSGTMFYFEQPCSQQAAEQFTSAMTSGGYKGKINACHVDVGAQTIFIGHDASIQKLDLLQIMRMHGFAAWYYTNGGNYKEFLSSDGESILSEQIKQ